MGVSKTIGATGADFVTANAFNSAQANGDTGVFLDATHTENVVITKQFHFIGNIADRGVTIVGVNGRAMLNNAPSADGCTYRNLNFKATGSSGITIAVQIRSGHYFSRCSFSGDTRDATFGCVFNNAAVNMFFNCHFFNNPTGAGVKCSSDVHVHSTIANCNEGFITVTSGTTFWYCLTGEMTGAEYGGPGIADVDGDFNVSEDATAPGNNPVTGFDPNDWTGKTTGDLTIRDAVKATTKALIAGQEPLEFALVDAFGNTRKTGGDTFAGNHDPNPKPSVAKPGQPAIVSFTASSGQVIVDLTVATAGDEVFVVFRADGTEAWSAENPTFSRVGSGTITITGLPDEIRHEFGIYAKETTDGLTSFWDTGFAIPTALTAAATRPLALYKVAIQNFFLNSTNLLDWIQTVDGGGTTATRVILGYAPATAPSDIGSKGPKVFVSTGNAVAVNDGSAKSFMVTLAINAEVVWFVDKHASAKFLVEKNFIDLLLDEALAIGLALDSTLSGSIESVTIPDVEGANQTPGQLPTERRTTFMFLISFTMPR